MVGLRFEGISLVAFSWGDLQQYARQKKNRTYILKPDTGCQGKGIWITKTPREIKATENLICQTYISRVRIREHDAFEVFSWSM